MTAKNLPSSITSYDLLKTAALILMIIDHTGAIFFPDAEWFRVIGRMSAPIWLFLIGYARTPDLSSPLWIGTALIAFANFAVGQPILPLCILATILICRILIDPVMNAITRRPAFLYPAAFLLFALSIVTFPWFDYGSSALLFVMAGYMVRNREAMSFNQSQLMQFVVIASGLYAIFELFMFVGFTAAQNLTTGFGILAVGMALTKFQPATYSSLSETTPKPLVWIVQLCGRRSLEIYVIHLILFKTMALMMGYEGYKLFDLHIL